jgi:hypothetical protein
MEKREQFMDWYECLPDFESHTTCKSLLGAKVELCFYLGESWVKLHRLQATPECNGRKALEEILQRADQFGVELRLDAGSYDTDCRKQWPQERLVKWYEQFGFVTTGTFTEDGNEFVKMQRMPNGKLALGGRHAREDKQAG